MKSGIAGVLAVVAFAANVANADMVLTNGTLRSLGSETEISAGQGSYEVHGVLRDLVYVNPVFSEQREVAWGDAEVEMTSDTLRLTGSARGSSTLFGPRYQGSVSGTIDFDVTEGRALFLDWDFLGDLTESHVSIYDGENDLLVQCVGSMGCGGATLPYGSPSEMYLSFAPGHYQLLFASHSEFGPGGSPVNNQFAFTLSPVPLPAAAWLLLSGLGGLGLLRRRRVL